MEDQENQTENILDNKERAYATGKRKNSIARVWLKRGSGEIKINGKPLDKYFSRPVLQMIVNQPLDVVKADNSYEIMASVKGGGLSGQAGAVKHGISKALSLFEPELRTILKSDSSKPLIALSISPFFLKPSPQFSTPTRLIFSLSFLI